MKKSHILFVCAALCLLAFLYFTNSSTRLQGVVMPMGTVRSSMPSSASVSVPPVKGQCTTQIVNGMIQRCCKIDYTMNFECRQYAIAFMDLCREQGIDSCKILGIRCENNTGHRINSVVIDGDLCLLDSQDKIISCDVDTPEEYQAAICKSMDLPPDCKCTATDRPYNPDDFASCGDSGFQRILFTPKAGGGTKFLFSDPKVRCLSCCQTYYVFRMEKPGAGEWLTQCQRACEGFSKGEMCQLPKKCKEGFVPDTCNRVTCRQRYNTGLCNIGDGTNCTIIERKCDKAILNCDDASM